MSCDGCSQPPPLGISHNKAPVAHIDCLLGPDDDARKGMLVDQDDHGVTTWLCQTCRRRTMEPEGVAVPGPAPPAAVPPVAPPPMLPLAAPKPLQLAPPPADAAPSRRRYLTACQPPSTRRAPTTACARSRRSSWPTPTCVRTGTRTSTTRSSPGSSDTTRRREQTSLWRTSSWCQTLRCETPSPRFGAELKCLLRRPRRSRSSLGRGRGRADGEGAGQGDGGVGRGRGESRAGRDGGDRAPAPASDPCRRRVVAGGARPRPNRAGGACRRRLPRVGAHRSPTPR